MRTRATMTISLPRQMIEEVENIRKTEHRTRSELIREALRMYMSRARDFPIYTPTLHELREIKKGRDAIRKGGYITLDEFRTWLLEDTGKNASAKNRSARASA